MALSSIKTFTHGISFHTVYFEPNAYNQFFVHNHLVIIEWFHTGTRTNLWSMIVLSHGSVLYMLELFSVVIITFWLG